LLMQTRDITGDNCEFGVFTGHTAVLIAALSPTKPLWLYDSFEGLPDLQEGDTTNPGSFFKGAMKSYWTEVTETFTAAKVLHRPIITAGQFNKVTPEQLPPQIAFAHIDCDLQQSVTDALKLVWARMAPRGIVVIDDFRHPELPGVERAVKDFAKWGQKAQINALKGINGNAWHCFAVKGS
jgi:O-methyltransferase